MNVFNKGDRVKVVKCGIHKDCIHIGKIYIVKKISDVNNNVYKLEGCNEHFYGSELELVDKLDLVNTKNIELEVGDRVTLNDNQVLVMQNKQDIENLKITLNTIREAKILKIERPKYEVIEYNNSNDILTDEEREFLKSYIKIIENLNNGKATSIINLGTQLVLHLKTNLDYYVEIGSNFKGLEEDKVYVLEELGL